MLIFEDVRFDFGARSRELSPPFNFAIEPLQKLAFICNIGFVQTSIVNVLAGISRPAEGRMIRESQISFPIGSIIGFSPQRSVRENIVRAARMYSADVRDVLKFVEAVIPLGAALERPFQQLSRPMQLHVVSVLGYAIPFDIYLFAGALGMPPNEYFDLYLRLFKARTQHAGAVVVTTDWNLARDTCDQVAIIENGAVRYHGEMAEAVKLFKQFGEAARPSGKALV